MPRAKLQTAANSIQDLLEQLDHTRQACSIQDVIIVRAPEDSVFAYTTYNLIEGRAGYKLKMLVTINVHEIVPDEGE